MFMNVIIYTSRISLYFLISDKLNKTKKPNIIQTLTIVTGKLKIIWDSKLKQDFFYIQIFWLPSILRPSSFFSLLNEENDIVFFLFRQCMLNPSWEETLVPDRITASLHGDLLYAM